MSKDFDRPLDQWVDETREVDQPTAGFDPVTKTVRNVRTEKVKVAVPTRYTRTSVAATLCPSGEHQYRVIDKHRYVAACRQCPTRRFYRPAYETIKDGHFIDRATNSIID